jgi:hypothetical protein
LPIKELRTLCTSQLHASRLALCSELQAHCLARGGAQRNATSAS